MKKYLLIAEKPSLMRAIKSVYINNISTINKSVGLIDFMALAGHVCRFIEPVEYDKWNIKWKDMELPLIPDPFKIDKIADKTKIINDIKSAIKENDYDGIIVATDADVEGNGIYYLLEHYLHLEKMEALRFYENGLTEKEIMKSFETLTDYHKNPRDVNMTDAFLIRSHMDWLIGMNFTIGFTVKSGFTMKVGRVKAPTLKLVYDNSIAIDEFVPHTDYAIESHYNTSPEFKGVALNDDGKELRFEDNAKAKAFMDKLPNKGIVKKVEKKTVKTQAPQLYKLSDIQAEAGKAFGYNPEKVLEIVQSLYEMKIVSYPRTSGRYISSEKAKEFPALLKAVRVFPELTDYVDKLPASAIKTASANKKVVNDAEVKKASHDALLPTGELPVLSKLNKDQYNICLMIYKRLLAIFLPPLEEDKMTVFVDADGTIFKSNGKKIVNEGYTKLYNKKLEETILPDLKVKEEIEIKEFFPVEKTTTPPQRLTEPTLIETMENISKYIEDKNLKSVMKEAKGIGMESSRAKIISDLIKSGYMESRGKSMSLYITETGKQYIKNLIGFSVVEPELTAEWETKMQKIREGDLTFKEVENEMLTYVKEVVKEIEAANIEHIGFASAKAMTGIKCPICGKPMIRSKYGIFCQGRKDGCKAAVAGTVAGKKLTDTQLKDLCEKQKTKLIKGFTSKTGKKFDAYLKLNIKDGETKIEMEFENAKPKSDKIFYCPRCKKPLVKGNWAYECECGVSIGYMIAHRKMNEKEIEDLITKGKTDVLSGFTSKTGKKFSARLELDNNGKVKFVF